MRWNVLIPKHRNDDAIKHADRRHGELSKGLQALAEPSIAPPSTRAKPWVAVTPIASQAKIMPWSEAGTVARAVQFCVASSDDTYSESAMTLRMPKKSLSLSEIM